MNPNTQKKVIAGNTVYTIGAGLLMNGVLQIIVYPLLNRHMGSEPLGNLLFIMGLTAIITPSIGQALNTSRLVVRRTEPVSNGDYNTMLLVYGSIGAVIALLIAGAMGQGTLGGIFGAAATFALILLMVFRYYGDVEFRLNLNYRNYFIYYAILTAGYLIGFGLYFITGIWYLIFVTGEAMAICYLVLRGTIFKNFLKTSIIDRKDDGASCGADQHDHNFLPDKAEGESGQKAVHDVRRRRTSRESCLLSGSGDCNAYIPYAFLREPV